MFGSSSVQLRKSRLDRLLSGYQPYTVGGQTIVAVSVLVLGSLLFFLLALDLLVGPVYLHRVRSSVASTAAFKQLYCKLD